MSTHAERALALYEKKNAGRISDVRSMQSHIDLLDAIEQTREPEREATDAEVVRFAKVVAVRHRQYEIAHHLRRLEGLLSDANPVPVEHPEREVPQPLTNRELVERAIPMNAGYLESAGLGIFRLDEIRTLAEGAGI